MNPTSDPNWQARVAADNGDGNIKWARTKSVVMIQHELVAIEHLGQRISFLAAAEWRLAEVIPNRIYDQDRLRVMRLALNSAFEAIEKAEFIAAKIDAAEGRGRGYVELAVDEQIEPTMDGIDQYAGDMSFQANAEAYMLGLVPSRRRPDPQALAFMKFLAQSMMSAVGSMATRGREM